MAEVEFSGLRLESAPGDVMTPRATSERLVAEACMRIDGAARVADVGTGSGALAIAIATARPEAQVWATDVDARAVRLARANVVRLGLAGRVRVRRGDLLEPVPGPLDVIVANLPYLAAATAASHPDLRAEPFDAVFAPGDGLDPYRCLVSGAATKLSPRGSLVLQLYGRVVTAERDELAELDVLLGRQARAA